MSLRTHPFTPTYDFTPLIICGRQRAGTRFITSALNKSKAACIQPEIPPAVTRSFVDFINGVDKFYIKQAESGDSRREGQLKIWKQKKPALIFNMWEEFLKIRLRL